MQLDKLIRSDRGTTLDGALLRIAERAAAARDTKTLDRVLDQIGELIKLATLSKDKNLVTRCRKLRDEFSRLIDNPRRALVVHMKSLVSNFKREEPNFDPNEVAAGTALGTIAGYGAVFNNVDFGNDKIIPGAFAKSLMRWKREGRLPTMLAQHDGSVFPIGVWTSMQEDATGLRVTGNVADTPRGREAWNLIHMTPSALDGLSIGYSVLDDDFDSNRVRILKELELFEISIVGLPMNTRARIDTGSAGKASHNLEALLRHARATVEREARSNIVEFPGRVTDSDERHAVELLTQLNETLRRNRKC
jgi:HK97 family phage prohead protease